MKLTKTQRQFLSDRTRSPIIQPSYMPPWMQKLWDKELIDVIGNSIHISGAGFAALAENRGETE